MVLALKNMLHPKIQKLVGGMRCLSRSALHALYDETGFRQNIVALIFWFFWIKLKEQEKFKSGIRKSNL